MKQMKKITAIILVVAMTALMFVLTSCSNKDVTKYQDSVVFINTTVRFSSTNYDISIPSSFTGTGFAVGVPGQPVQYIATCAHCVGEPEGVYALKLDQTSSTYISMEKVDDGTEYPKYTEVTEGGVSYAIIYDYFTTETVDLRAVYSESSNDYVSLTVAQINNDVDLAICKIASAPTTKITALPIQLKRDVKIGADVVSIGYPGTSMYFNTEGRFDSADSTVKDGIVSKLQRTTGMTGSKTTFDTYEVTAQMSSGMSGGPVISLASGAVIGVNSFQLTDISEAAAAKYAICIDYMRELLDREGIEYTVVEAGISPIILIGVALGVLLILAIVIVVVLLKKPASNTAVPVNAGATEIQSNVTQMKKYYLIATSGPLSGKRYAITNNAVIGRDSSKCNVVFPIDQPGVSGVHCEIKLSGDILTIRDCGSSYGTFLENGTKLDSNVAVVIRGGSKFYVGSSANAFEVSY